MKSQWFENTNTDKDDAMAYIFKKTVRTFI